MEEYKCVFYLVPKTSSLWFPPPYEVNIHEEMGFCFCKIILDSFNHGMCLFTGVAQNPGEDGQAEGFNGIRDMRL